MAKIDTHYAGRSIYLATNAIIFHAPAQPYSPHPDIMHLAQDNLGTADQVTVFGGLLDAAIRSTWSMALEAPKRKAVLNDTLDQVYQEMKRAVPAQIDQHPRAAPPLGKAAGA